MESLPTERPVLIHPAERVPLARLLRLLEEGERMAHECAKAQARLAAHDGQRRFFLAQARQERMHAFLFGRIADGLAPRDPVSHPALAPLAFYRRLLESAIRRGDLLETVLAEQVVLEGMGEAILHRVEAGLVARNAPLTGLRRLLLAQEEAHAGFGARALARALEQGIASQPELVRRAEPYLALAKTMFLSLAGELAVFDEDAGGWASGVSRYLPHWLTTGEPGARMST